MHAASRIRSGLLSSKVSLLFADFALFLTGVILPAYKTVLRSYGIDSNPTSDNENGGSDLEVMDVSINY